MGTIDLALYPGVSGGGGGGGGGDPVAVKCVSMGTVHMMVHILYFVGTKECNIAEGGHMTLCVFPLRQS